MHRHILQYNIANANVLGLEDRLISNILNFSEFSSCVDIFSNRVVVLNGFSRLWHCMCQAKVRRYIFLMLTLKNLLHKQ